MPQPIAESAAAGRRVVSRRVILKAASSFTAMAAGAKAGIRPALAASDLADVRAGEWIEADSAAANAAADSSGMTVFETDFPFTSIAPHWGADGPEDAYISIQVSVDGANWSDFYSTSVDNHDVGQRDREGRRFGSLVFLEAEATFVRYSMTDFDGNPIILPELAFSYLDPSQGPSIGGVRAAAVTPTTAPPPIISRAAWGAKEAYLHEDQDPKKPIWWVPEYQTVEKVIIHHSATPNFQDPLATVRSIYYYHAVTRGWYDIGYNYLVDWQGNVYEGRVGGDDVVGGHAYQYAYGSSGICTIGNFMKEMPTDEALAALIWITAWVGRKLDPWGSGPFHEQPDFPTIAGHRDCYSEACPGDLLYLELDDIRQAVAETLSYAEDPAGEAAFSTGDVVGVTVEGTNLRAGPGTDFSVLREMSAGTSGTVLDGPVSNSGFAWYRISDDIAGWCVENNLEFWSSGGGGGDDFSTGDTVSVATEILNVRDAAGLSGSVVTRLYTGDSATVVSGPTNRDGYSWYRLDYGDGAGWAVGQYLELESSGGSGGGFGIGDTVIVDTDSLRLRSAAGTAASTIASMPNGTRLTITADPVDKNGYTWFKVSGDYGTGWCAGDYLALTNASGEAGLQIGDRANVIDGTLNLREGPSTSDRILYRMADGTEVEILGGPATVNGIDWYQVTSDRYGDGWCAGEYLEEL